MSLYRLLRIIGQVAVFGNNKKFQFSYYFGYILVSSALITFEINICCKTVHISVDCFFIDDIYDDDHHHHHYETRRLIERYMFK